MLHSLGLSYSVPKVWVAMYRRLGCYVPKVLIAMYKHLGCCFKGLSSYVPKCWVDMVIR